MMLASMQRLANRPSAWATNGVVCPTLGGVTDTPMLIFRISLQSWASTTAAESIMVTMAQAPSNSRAGCRRDDVDRASGDAFNMAPSSLRALPDGDTAAGGFDRIGREFHVDDLVDCRLFRLVDKTVGDIIIDLSL